MQKQRRWPLGIIALTIFVVCLLSVPLFVGLYTKQKITFNQFMMHDLGVTSSFEYANSMYARGFDILFGKKLVRTPPAFDDSDQMFDYIYSHVPSKAYVYPTEGFYYFMTTLGDGTAISGNIRIADLVKSEPKFSFAYFTMTDRKSRKTKIKNVSQKDGLEKVERLGDFRFRTTYKGRKVEFKLVGQRAASRRLPELQEDEEVAAVIFDESGVGFDLVFNTTTDSHYFVLSPKSFSIEHLEPVTGLGNLMISSRTKFAYYVESPNRKILVGVNLGHIQTNDFFDGPGDQVAFWENLRPQIRLNYPNAMRGAGIDEHGVYLKRPRWQRIAISPYSRYTAVSDLERKTKRCERKWQGTAYLTTCLTKEFWNNPRFRAHSIYALEREGKKIDDIQLYQIPKQATDLSYAEILKKFPPPKSYRFPITEKRWEGIRLIKEYKRKKYSKRRSSKGKDS